MHYVAMVMYLRSSLCTICCYSDNLDVGPHVSNLVPRLRGREKIVWYRMHSHIFVKVIVWFMGIRLQCQERGRQQPMQIPHKSSVYV